MREAAGCIVTRHNKETNQIEYLAIRRYDKNGFDFPGGKQEPGESRLANAVREIYEETGLVVIANPIDFYMENDGEFNFTLFRAHVVAGELKSSHEGTTEWVNDPRWLLTGSFPIYNHNALMHFGALSLTTTISDRQQARSYRYTLGQLDETINEYCQSVGIYPLC